MSVELEKTIIKTCYSLPAMGTQITLDNDIIVPDSQPDVKTVLQAEILPMICEKHVQKDYIIITGNVDYSIVYLSDEKDSPSRVRAISTRMPFSHQIEVADVNMADFVSIKPDVINVEFSAVNSRKINVRSVVDFDTSAVRCDGFEAVCSAVCDSDLPSKSEIAEWFALSGCGEMNFEVADTISIPSGSDLIDEILGADVKICGREIKLINGKPVVKGDVKICVLYTDTAYRMQTAEGSIPFTEILGIDDVEDERLCEIEYCLTDFRYSIMADNDGDATLIDVCAKINVSACAYSTGRENITADLYSPDFKVDIIRGNAELTRLVSANSEQDIFKDTVEVSPTCPAISKVHNVIVKPYVENAEIMGGRMKITGVADTYIVYTTSSPDTPVYTYKKEIPFTHSAMADGKEDCNINVICEANDIIYNAISANGVQVQFTLNFNVRITEEKNLTYISHVESDGTVSEDSAPTGIVIYFADAGENMWDISKRYHTTTEAINKANGVDFPEVLDSPKRIMIPKRRIG
ncbi:MAG: DUF3794 domain-containing protein [Clostridia bacterium]|nr:DUF3794 domain-containing protein [Clostridia bacterium]